jgi:hypothetical protein
MKITASAEQVIIAREAARRSLVINPRGTRREHRRFLKSEVARYGDIGMYILLIRLAMFIIGWWLANQVAEPSSVMTADEPWADQDQFTFESEEDDA